MSFEEVNMLSMVELLDFLNEYVGEEEKGSIREATQEDIDKLFK